MVPLVQLGSHFLLFYVFRSKLLVDVRPGKIFAATFCSGHKTLAFSAVDKHDIWEESAPCVILRPS